MEERLQFATREQFRQWLGLHATSKDGVWLLFGKPGGPKTLKASEALEEALCYGWIDGQMKTIDTTSYIKYFALRRQNSKWSDKNKALVKKLEQQGVLTNYGRAKIEEAKENGQWDAPKPPEITDSDIEQLATLIQGQEPAFTNFKGMAPSVKKTYTRAYLDAKTEEGRTKRLEWILTRLHNNQKPM